MAAIEKIIITRDTFGAEPRIQFSVSDRQALKKALEQESGETSRSQILSNLLARMCGFSGLNMPPDWKDIFLSGETFSWEFLPDSTD